MLISVPEWDSIFAFINKELCLIEHEHPFFAFINKELCLIEHEHPLVNKGYPMEIIAYV